MGGSGEITAGIGSQSESGGVFCGIPQGQHGVVLGGGDQGGARHGRGACRTSREGVIQLLVVQSKHQLTCLGDACLIQDQISARLGQQEDGILHPADVRVGDDAVAGEGHVLAGRNGEGVVVGHDGVEIRIGDGAAGFPCRTLGACGTGFPLGTLRTNGTLHTLGTLFALRSCGTLFALRSCGTLLALRPCGTLFTLRPCGTLFALRPCGTLFALRPCGTLLALRPYGTLFALRPCGTLLTLRPYGTLLTPRPLGTLFTLRALRPYRPGFPYGTLGTNGALNALNALRTLFPLRACGALFPLRTLGSSGTGDAEAGLASATAIAIFLLRRAGGRVTATAGVALKRILSVQKNAS